MVIGPAQDHAPHQLRIPDGQKQCDDAAVAEAKQIDRPIKQLNERLGHVLRHIAVMILAYRGAFPMSPRIKQINLEAVLQRGAQRGKGRMILSVPMKHDQRHAAAMHLIIQVDPVHMNARHMLLLSSP